MIIPLHYPQISVQTRESVISSPRGFETEAWLRGDDTTELRVTLLEILSEHFEQDD